jgi:hypothetical protein
MALGSGRIQIAAMILREALLTVLAGIALGIPAAMATSHLMRSQLYGLGPYDHTVRSGDDDSGRGTGLLYSGHTRDADRSDGRVAIRIDRTKLLESSWQAWIPPCRRELHSANDGRGTEHRSSSVREPIGPIVKLAHETMSQAIGVLTYPCPESFRCRCRKKRCPLWRTSKRSSTSSGGRRSRCAKGKGTVYTEFCYFISLG